MKTKFVIKMNHLVYSYKFQDARLLKFESKANKSMLGWLFFHIYYFYIKCLLQKKTCTWEFQTDILKKINRRECT